MYNHNFCDFVCASSPIVSGKRWVFFKFIFHLLDLVVFLPYLLHRSLRLEERDVIDILSSTELFKVSYYMCVV